MKPRLFLDLDGVIADFDKTAEQILGTDNIYKFEFIWGADEFWRRINTVPDFFRKLEMKPDAWVLLSATAHMNRAFLTALPHVNPGTAARLKSEWVWEHFGYNMPIICYETKDKPKPCRPGDILIDDRAVNKAAWEAAGGRYIIHTSAGESVAQLRAWGVI